MVERERRGTSGTLYVVSTPIGNMGDFSFRAAEVLRAAAVILAEDTRHSRPLLDRYEIGTPLAAYHEHNEARATPGIVARLQGGEDVALISDAGTPLLSDPGARLVHAAIEQGIPVVPIPGASALLAALVGAGFDVDRFTYYGFLPRKGRERSELLTEIAACRHTVVLYEAPTRLAATLQELAERGPADRPATVARELTKQFEEFRRGTLASLAAYYEAAPPKGEVVVVLAGVTPMAVSEEILRERARALRAEGRSTRDTAAALVAEHGVGRNLAYRIASEA